MDLSHLSPCFSRLRRRKQGSLWWNTCSQTLSFQRNAHLRVWADMRYSTPYNWQFQWPWSTLFNHVGVYLQCRSNVKQVAGVARIQVWSCINDHFRYRTWRYQIYMAMNQYLLIPFLEGWTSIYQLFYVHQGTRFWPTAICDSRYGLFRTHHPVMALQAPSEAWAFWKYVKAASKHPGRSKSKYPNQSAWGSFSFRTSWQEWSQMTQQSETCSEWWRSNK